ncbi:hypothetical protein RDABS01_014923 [Bienertia sinuspersici]
MSPFWVRIYNLPFNCRSNAETKSIATKLGEVLEMEEDVLGLENFCRVKVMVDVTKPLRRSQRVKNKEERVITVNYKYKRLPFFCFICGVIGYGEKDCPNGEDEETGRTSGWGHG